MLSPVEARHLTRSIRLKDVAWDSDGETLVWLEGRGVDNVIVCQSGSDRLPRDLTGGYSVRARVGYGGGEFTVGCGQVYFVESGNCLCAVAIDSGEVRPLTTPSGYPASPTASKDGRWLIYVHSDGEIDCLAICETVVDANPRPLCSLTTGADFYMQPTWHPRGHLVAWIEWDHPQMPWDGTRLVLGRLRQDVGGLPELESTAVIAGGPHVAVFQPAFSPDGRFLSFVTDEPGAGCLRLFDLEAGTLGEPLLGGDGDMSQPAWIQGLRAYAWAPDSGQIYLTRAHEGFRKAFCLDLESECEVPLEALADFTDVTQICVSPGRAEIACIASSSRVPARLFSITTDGARNTRASSCSQEIEPSALSQALPIEWSSSDAERIHGLYHPAVATGGNEPPPLIVDVHGGPTGHTDAGYSGETQYFTTRGFSVLAVNFRGSTGYGRSYMEALRGNWGVVDVEDAMSGARHLVERGHADPQRLVILGGSSGGYTVLRALTMHPGFFRAGVCRYGLTDLVALARQSHKFESRYFDSLLDTLPEGADLYRERSPLYAADKLVDPVILFQGDADDIVPKAQSDAIVESLRQRGVPHEYVVYEGEGHGFRKPETLQAYIKSVESFLERHVLTAPPESER